MRDNEQRKLKRKGNEVKETPKMHPIDLAVDDAKIIHISGAMTAREMWELLTIMMVKESEGDLGILAMRRELCSATTAVGFEYISNKWKS